MKPKFIYFEAMLKLRYAQLLFSLLLVQGLPSCAVLPVPVLKTGNLPVTVFSGS